MRKKIVAGNWKMNNDLQAGIHLIEEIKKMYAFIQDEKSAQVIIIPSFVQLLKASEQLADSKISLGAQNVHHKTHGAYTGEVSAEMLSSVNAKYCLVGHSERRIYQGEINEELFAKVQLLLAQNIIPIYCLGEQLEDRNTHNEFDVVKNQLEVVFELTPDEFSNLIIAYEPVWAIGTGKTATADQAQEMHAFLRREIQTKYGQSIADSISILYGGSCKPENATELFSKSDVDGGLIGGASLDAASFIGIIKAI